MYIENQEVADYLNKVPRFTVADLQYRFQMPYPQVRALLEYLLEKHAVEYLGGMEYRPCITLNVTTYDPQAEAEEEKRKKESSPMDSLRARFEAFKRKREEEMERAKKRFQEETNTDQNIFSDDDDDEDEDEYDGDDDEDDDDEEEIGTSVVVTHRPPMHMSVEQYVFISKTCKLKEILVGLVQYEFDGHLKDDSFCKLYIRGTRFTRESGNAIYSVVVDGQRYFSDKGYVMDELFRTPRYGETRALSRIKREVAGTNVEIGSDDWHVTVLYREYDENTVLEALFEFLFTVDRILRV